ncbi:MAG: S8 family serine peptidase [Chitinophagales bacterium]|nr:S8 family serine peptidase [Bacteroidota bacterium]MCB9042792.1 S8 family serine peptidase [Chitinophagales bacterium]
MTKQTILSIFCAVFFIVNNGLFAQEEKAYWISLSDKNHNEYSLHNASTFLSPAALERRQRQNISLNETDLPISPSYKQQILATGAREHAVSKWFNAITVWADDAAIAQITQLPFVKSVKCISRHAQRSNLQTKKLAISTETLDDDFFGDSFNQLKMMQGDLLQLNGFRGENMLIAIMDAGYVGLENSEALAKVRNNNQIVFTYDYVHHSSEISSANSSHGYNVFCLLAGSIPDKYSGSAPNAQYALFVTEDVSSETPIEESNWLAAAEKADSLGADVLSTSLGYSVFDAGWDSYTYEDMNGETTIITRAADMAAAKGMLVINSAGNEGNDAWKYITAPADGDSVLTVGAVNPEGIYAGFSSQGPTFDGRIKPNIMAQGASSVLITPLSDIVTGSGTSYATPILAGLAACLWQSAPETNNMDIFTTIETTASQALNPDYFMGYGIPNFAKAYEKLHEKTLFTHEENDPRTHIFYQEQNYEIVLYSDVAQKVHLDLYNSTGQLLASFNIQTNDNQVYELAQYLPSGLNAGVYFYQIKGDNFSETQKIVQF